jgi:hypothetical protein
VGRAVERYGYPNTDETKRELFERWERFWALATLEYRKGVLPRGDWDAMRGIRGAVAAWKPGDDRLPSDFPLISRQQELGNLGAYLAPLRRAGLVHDGGLGPTPAALEMLECFWDEADNGHRGRYEDYALSVLEPRKAKFDRKHGNLTLRRVGEQSRLSSLVALERSKQQDRLYSALFAKARDANTYAVSILVENAAKSGVLAPRAVLDAAIAGKLGATDAGLNELLITARGFGDYMRELMAAFDRIYVSIDRAGWIVPRGQVASDALSESARVPLNESAARLLDTPCVGEIRRLPMHGAPCLRLAEDLKEADASTALDLILAYHGAVQRDRRRGAGWFRDEGGQLVLAVTSYTAHADQPRFPSFKLNAVATLLSDTGRLTYPADAMSPETGS